jgi:cytidylate kinase
MDKRLIVAIDGPAGVGKSTVARGVAKRLGYLLIDTGALYRSVAWLAEVNGIDWHLGSDLGRLVSKHHFSFDPKGMVLVDGKPVEQQIRSTHISKGASVVAGCAEVRQALLEIQRDLGRDGGVVMEGRDIGTVVFPDAQAKFYLTADARIRAKRRFDELLSRGVDVTFEEIERDQERRDLQDRNRAVAPLRRADDAEEIDASHLTADDVVALIVQYVLK